MDDFNVLAQCLGIEVFVTWSPAAAYLVNVEFVFGSEEFQVDCLEEFEGENDLSRIGGCCDCEESVCCTVYCVFYGVCIITCEDVFVNPCISCETLLWDDF